MNVLVPGLPEGWVDSLREAAENDEQERAHVLVADLHRLMSSSPTISVQAVSAVLKNQVLSPLSGDMRRRVEAFIESLGIGNI